MSEIKFALTTSLAPVHDFRLDANFAEVEAQLRELMAPYEKLQVDPNDMASAKDILARIRKVKTSIDEYRKSIKREYTAPLTAFESRVKELLAVCNESETNLSSQISKYDLQRRTAKLECLEQFFNDAVGDMAPYITWEQVKNDRWGNATFSDEDAKAEISKAVSDCSAGVEAIRSMGSPYTEAMLNAFVKNHDLAAAMRLNGELSEQKRREDEHKAALEAAKTTAQREEIREVQQTVQPVLEPTTEDADKLLHLTLKMWGTREQLVRLRKFLDSSGMRFLKVD